MVDVYDSIYISSTILFLLRWSACLQMWFFHIRFWMLHFIHLSLFIPLDTFHIPISFSMPPLIFFVSILLLPTIKSYIKRQSFSFLLFSTICHFKMFLNHSSSGKFYKRKMNQANKQTNKNPNKSKVNTYLMIPVSFHTLNKLKMVSTVH